MAAAGRVLRGKTLTEELGFCAGNAMACGIERLDIRKIGEAYERMKRGDLRYRFVIDMATLKET